MNITGPSVVGNVQKSDDAGLVLRLNQRVSAEVLNVSGENVTLAIQGVRVVGKLTSADQAASLVEQKVAQFLIKDLTNGIVTLQLVDKTAQSQQAEAVNPQDLTAVILQSKGLPVDKESLMLARVMLAKSIPLTAQNLEELRAALSGLGKWGETELNLAANLKTAGLPLTSGSLSLAMDASKNFTDELSALINQLKQLSSQPQFSNIVKPALDTLQGILLKWNQSASEMAENLPRLVDLLGSSMEHEIGELAKGNAESLPKDLQSLLLLRNTLSSRGANQAVETLDRFMDSLRYIQLNNTHSETDPNGGQWARLEVPLNISQAADSTKDLQNQLHEAGLRIAYKKEASGRVIDPKFTRLVVQVDVADGETVEVDLSIVEKKIAASVTTTTALLKDLAQEEIPGLQDGLAAIGYALQTMRLKQGKVTKDEIESEKTTGENFTVVNVRI
jgi:hypothetical protein